LAIKITAANYTRGDGQLLLYSLQAQHWCATSSLGAGRRIWAKTNTETALFRQVRLWPKQTGRQHSWCVAGQSTR